MRIRIKNLRRNIYKLIVLNISEFILFFEDKNSDTKYRNILLRRIGFNIGKNVIIDKSLSFYDPKTIQIGNNVLIRENCYFDHHIIIEDFVTISKNVSIIVAGHKPGTMEYIMKPVKICKFSWIGANSLILPGVEVGVNSCVAAGSVVTKNVEPYTLVGGVPAKFIRRIETPEFIYNQFGKTSPFV